MSDRTTTDEINIIFNKAIAKYKEYLPVDELESIKLNSIFIASRNYDSSKGSYNNYLWGIFRIQALLRIKELKPCKKIHKNNTYDLNYNKIIVDEMLSKLSPIDKDMIVMKYIENFSLKEIAKKYSKSITYIYNNIQKNIKFLKDEYNQ